MKQLEKSIFSAETLDSLAMAEVCGGDEVTNNCYGGNCVANCDGSDGGNKQGNCGDISVNVTTILCGVFGKKEESTDLVP